MSTWDSGNVSGAGWSEADVEGDASPALGKDHPFDVGDAGRYRLGPTIGVGGMGKVRVAWDQRLRRDVAYKEVRREATGDISRRLAREAWITATLDHPGIVPVHDAGRDSEGRLFYTMRMVRGHSLDRALEKAADRLDLLRAFLVVCETVAYAHSRGVVHRDLKPANIMVGQFGEVQVVDWGLAAKLGEVERHPLDEWEEADERLTRVGAVVGTPAYMSPEQARGESASVGADVWSLGAVLYELLTGGPPFVSDGATTTLERAREGVFQPVMEREAGAPPALAAVAERALAADPADRYPDAAALALEVARFLDGRRVDAYSYSSRELMAQLLWRWRAPVGVGAAALLVLAIVTGVGVERIRQERDRAIRSETSAASALERANIELARTLTEQAVQAARRDARPEAERFAAAALMLHDAPTARGVLARFAARPAPVPVRTEPLPDCRRQAMFGDMLLCMNRADTSLWDAAGEVRWTSPQGAWKGWLSEAHDAVLLVSGWDRRLVLLSATDGSVRGSWTGVYLDRDVSLFGQPGDATVLWMDKTTRGRVDLVAGTADPMAPMCPEGEPMRLAARNPKGDGMVAVCGRGRVRVTTVAGEGVHEWWIPWEGFAAPEEIAWNETPDALAVVTYGGEILLRDLATGEVLQSPSDLGMRPDSLWTGRLLAVSGGAGVGTRLWDPRTGGWVGWLPGWAGDVVSLSDDGRFARTAGEELVTWDLGAQRQTLVFESEGGLSAAVPSRDGKWLAITGADGASWLSSVETGERRHVAANQPWSVGPAAFNLDQTAAYAPLSSRPGLMRLDMKSGVWAPLGNEHAYRRVGALAGGAMLAVPEARSGLDLIEADQTLVQASGDLVGEYYDLAVSEDGGTALLASVDGTLWHFSGHTREAFQLLDVKRAFALAMAPDAGSIALGMRGEIQLLDADGTERSTLAHDGKLLLDLALSPDGRWLAVADTDGSVYVYRQRSGSLAAVLPYHSDAVAHVGFAGDGQLFSAGRDGRVLRYDLSVLDAPVGEVVESVRASWGTLGPLAESVETEAVQPE